MTREVENLRNMMRCPRFVGCDIPRCPLDYWMQERTELPEDKQCPLTRLLVQGKHKKRLEGRLSPQMRGLFRFIPDRNKVATKKAKSI